MPFSAAINNFYWDFGNGYIPFFSVIGNYNLVVYGDNPVNDAINAVPDAIYTFHHMIALFHIPEQTMEFNQQVEIDVSNVFADPFGNPITVTLMNNSDPAVVGAELNGNNLILNSYENFGTSTIELMGNTDVDVAFSQFEVIVVPPTSEIAYEIEDSPPQQVYPNNQNPYSNSLTDLGWTQIDVPESNELIYVRLTLTWHSVDYASEGSLHLTSPAGTDIQLYQSVNTDIVDLEFFLYDFSGENMLGTWDLYMVDSYGDGGHQVTNATIYYAVESDITYYPPDDVQIDSDTGLLTWSPPYEPLDFLDDFEGYSVGDYLADVNPEWTTWSNAPGGFEDGTISDEQAYSGTQSLKLVTDNDQVLPLGTLNSGVYMADLMIYVPAGHCGYFNLLHDLDDNGGSNQWALEVYFRDTGLIDINAGGTNSASTTYIPDTWVECSAYIDMDNDMAEFYIDGNLIHSWQWSLQANGSAGLNQLEAMNIWGGGAAGQVPLFYADDVHVYFCTTSREVASYNVYLDDMETPLATGITDTQYQYTDLVHGQEYTAGVSAVYDDAEESSIVQLTFTYTGTGAGDDLVLRTELKGNYPNPFNPDTKIVFSLKEDGYTDLVIYNLRGQIVRNLFAGEQKAGYHELTWDGRDNNRNPVTSGVYFYKLQSGTYNSTRKMILLK
ncbi:MAG: T9SS type A sorting domain-containing protein [Candidatus Cloacimonetes bacterium]|nr:T9SS type A sorting domain-containing protein [Candidatus Cloacimonadota bacterium]